MGELDSVADEYSGLKGYEIPIILRERYAEKFGIADLGDPFKPLALVAESPRDGNHLLWPLYNKIRRFQMLEVHKHYGLNLIDFLSLPRDVTEMILTELRDEAFKEAEARKAMQSKINRGGQVDMGGSLLDVPPHK